MGVGRSTVELEQFIVMLADCCPELPIPKGPFYRGLRMAPPTIKKTITDMIVNQGLACDMAGHYFKFGRNTGERAPNSVTRELEVYPQWVEDVLQWFLSSLTEFDRSCVTKKTMQKWRHTVWLCHKVERTDHEKILEVCKWARGHKFWGKIFTSLTKLRKHSAGDERMYYLRWISDMEKEVQFSPMTERHVNLLLGKSNKEVDKPEK